LRCLLLERRQEVGFYTATRFSSSPTPFVFPALEPDGPIVRPNVEKRLSSPAARNARPTALADKRVPNPPAVCATKHRQQRGGAPPIRVAPRLTPDRTTRPASSAPRGDRVLAAPLPQPPRALRVVPRRSVRTSPWCARSGEYPGRDGR